MAPRLAIRVRPAPVEPFRPQGFIGPTRPGTRPLTRRVPQSALYRAFGVPLRDRLPLVVRAATTSEPELYLCQPVVKVQPERDHRRSRALPQLPVQPVKLPAVEQELARARRIVAFTRRRVMGDMHIVQPQLAVVKTGLTLGDARLALAERLDLGADEHDAGVERLQQLVVVPGPAVDRHGYTA